VRNLNNFVDCNKLAVFFNCKILYDAELLYNLLNCNNFAAVETAKSSVAINCNNLAVFIRPSSTGLGMVWHGLSVRPSVRQSVTVVLVHTIT
jgi:hypothetical protein